MENSRIQYYHAPITKNQVPELEFYSLEQIATEIRSGNNLIPKHLIGDVRAGRAEKRDTLPFVTFGGVFDYRSRDPKKLQDLRRTGLLSFTGYVNLDLDHLKGYDLRELKDKIIQDTVLNARLVFISPSGDGIKIVIQSKTKIASADDYKRVFLSACGYIRESYGIPYDTENKESGRGGIDTGISDITRGCFLSYDPEVFYRESGEYDETGHPVKEEKRQGETIQRTQRTTPPEGNLSSFVDDVLIPAIFERIPDIFPDMDFILKGGDWQSPYKRDGSLPRTKRQDKTVITKYNPYGVIEQGEDPIRVIEYYAERNGISSWDAIQRLSAFCGLTPPQRQEKYNIMNAPTAKTPEQAPQAGRDFSEMITPITGESFKEAILAESEGIGTKYEFRSKDGKESTPLLIPSGSITLICGMSGHCKSSYLRNLFLNMRDEVEGDLLYFSFEESRTKTIRRLLNTYIGRELSNGKNIDRIVEFFQTGSYQYIREEERQNFISKVEEFSSFLSQGKLRIYAPDYTAPEIVEAIKYYLSTGRKVGAIFIDYIQYLRSGKKTPSRAEEILAVIQPLHDFAKESNIPFIVAAQLNRATKSW